MRRKLALVTTAILAGATVSTAAATPAQAQECQSPGDPIIGFVCTIVNNAPDVKETISYYYNEAVDTVHFVYCTVSPRC